MGDEPLRTLWGHQAMRGRRAPPQGEDVVLPLHEREEWLSWG